MLVLIPAFKVGAQEPSHEDHREGVQVDGLQYLSINLWNFVPSGLVSLKLLTRMEIFLCHLPSPGCATQNFVQMPFVGFEIEFNCLHLSSASLFRMALGCHQLRDLSPPESG